MKVAVVHGGTSTEAEFSTENARDIHDALLRLGYDSILVDYDEAMIEKIRQEKADIAFLCVQGMGHGDGTCQGLFDFYKIPYTGTRMQQAAIINEKIVCQALFQDAGLPVAKHFFLSRQEYFSSEGKEILHSRMAEHGMAYPIVSKSTTQGACMGIELIMSEDNYADIEKSFDIDERILIEDYCEGDAFTISLLETAEGWQELPFIAGRRLVNTEHGPEFKLDLYRSIYRITDVIERRLIEEAKRVADITGARDYCRIDFMYDRQQDREAILEINAVPGLRRMSFLPLAAKAAGIGYDELIDMIVKSAVRNSFKR